MRALLDVNVLIAMLDENHAHHATVSDWLADHIEHEWAPCPLTQNGCDRMQHRKACLKSAFSPIMKA